MVALAYFRIIRLPLLVIIAFMQYATRHFIIEPILMINGYELQMSNQAFGYLVLATVLIAAGGYAINDYFDAKIDRINKPHSVVLDRLIKRRVAMAMHIVLTSSGFILAGYLSYSLGMWKMTSLFIFAIFSLWFYSTNFKHQFIVGNLIIAALAGSIPLVVGLFEIPLLNAQYPESVEELGYSIFNVPAYWVMGFSAFITMLTMAREITKDVVDIKGDKLFGGETIPIRLGIKKTKGIIMGLYGTIAIYMMWLYQVFIVDHSLQVKLIFGLIFLAILTQIILIFMAKTKTQFSRSALLNGALVVSSLLALYTIRVSILAYFS